MRLREDLGERRVADLAVERDDVASCGAERGERLAVGLTRCDLVAEVVARQLQLPARERVRVRSVRLRDVDLDVAQAAELFDCLLRMVERLAVPTGLVLDLLDALPFYRPRDHDG